MSETLPKPKKSVALSGVAAGNTALCTVGRIGNDLHYRASGHQGHLRIARIEGDGDERFLFPNDLASGPDGPLCMTDSGMVADGLISGQNFVPNVMDLPYDGRVCQIDPGTGRVLRRIDSGIRFANGIACDAAGHRHANASFTGDVYGYDMFGAGTPRRQLFGNVLQPDDRPVFRGPDGMKFGAGTRF